MEENIIKQNSPKGERGPRVPPTTPHPSPSVPQPRHLYFAPLDHWEMFPP